MQNNSFSDISQKSPRISIITPSLNQGIFIEQTILSVLEQEYPNFEHIVVDAGSTDQTIETLKKYPHLRWISEPDKGQAHAINKGIMVSTGEIIAYLNSDDVYRPGAFNAISVVFTQEPSTQIVVGNCDYIDENSKVTGFLKATYENYEGLIRYWGWDKWFCIPQQSVFMRRSVLAEVGLFDITYKMVMDYEMWLRIAYIHPFRVVDHTLAAFRIAPDTKTVSRTYEMYLEEIQASKVHWKKLPFYRRMRVAIEAYYYIGHKMLNVGEHFAFTLTGGISPLKLLKAGFLKWPLLILNPRFCLTAAQHILRKTRFLGHVRLIHSIYLKLKWKVSSAFRNE